MGQLIVIEGLDGSGKQTLTARLCADLRAKDARVATLTFPRYGQSVHADLVKDALYGRLGDLSDSVYGTALLFALDRRDAREQIASVIAENDVVLLDRYVSSNAAYGSARLGGPQTDTGFAQWVQNLEIDRFGLAVPDQQLLLATDTALAAQRAAARAATHTDRALDNFESDAALQLRTAGMYEQLAVQAYLSPWTVLRPDEDGQVELPANLWS